MGKSLNSVELHGCATFEKGFHHTYRSYGVTLWYPTYISELTTQKDLEEFERFCNNTVNVTGWSHMEAYCDCSQTVFSDVTLTDSELRNFRIHDVLFSNVSFQNINFDSVVFNSTQFVDCQFYESNFTDSLFNSTQFENVLFHSVNIHSSSLCSMNGSAVEVCNNSLILEEVDVNGDQVDYEMLNTSAFQERVLNRGNGQKCSENKLLRQIQCKPPDNRVYRDSFFVSASALPGNIASAIAVYFLRRNYWLGKFQ